MKIPEFIAEMQKLDSQFRNIEGKKYSEFIIGEQDIWSNEAAKGYVIRAALSLGATHEQIRALLNELHYLFDVMSVEEAEQFYEDDNY